MLSAVDVDLLVSWHQREFSCVRGRGVTTYNLDIMAVLFVAAGADICAIIAEAQTPHRGIHPSQGPGANPLTGVPNPYHRVVSSDCKVDSAVV